MMQIETPLTKDNFWDALYALYPEGTQVFCKWIDEYKKAVNWNHLMNPAFSERHISGYAETRLTEKTSTKFHDLPHAMQMGIFIEFMRSRGGCQYEVDLFEFDLRVECTEVIKMLQCEWELGTEVQS